MAKYPLRNDAKDGNFQRVDIAKFLENSGLGVVQGFTIFGKFFVDMMLMRTIVDIFRSQLPEMPFLEKVRDRIIQFLSGDFFGTYSQYEVNEEVRRVLLAGAAAANRRLSEDEEEFAPPINAADVVRSIFSKLPTFAEDAEKIFARIQSLDFEFRERSG